MCIEHPGRIVALSADSAIVETVGRRRLATTLMVPEVAVGDWVVVVGGTVVDRLTEEEARTIEALLSGGERDAPRAIGSPSGPESEAAFGD